MAGKLQAGEIMARLKDLANPENVAGMARFGISAHNTYGISIPNLRSLAREAGKDHTLALALWQTGIHEARLLACMVDTPKAISESQMEQWVQDFDSWDICDQCCGNLFDKTPWAYEKAVTWSAREAEFVKRAGFVLMTQLAVHDKKAPDEKFLPFLPIIYREATDERNFVKKAVNWALRQIGKRNARLNQAAIATANEIQTINAKSARWIAADALRELTSTAVQRRIGLTG
ncbi:MAG: DNA alkylation repair protein [Chloroflexi bacterium]|nr:DNA alkylation repair protein [Chloroflexota bacterium]